MIGSESESLAGDFNWTGATRLNLSSIDQFRNQARRSTWFQVQMFSFFSIESVLKHTKLSLSPISMTIMFVLLIDFLVTTFVDRSLYKVD